MSMYLSTVRALMAVLPIGSIGAEHLYFHRPEPIMLLVGKWFVFWGAGIRLFLAGDLLWGCWRPACNGAGENKEGPIGHSASER